jgi:hypothetical protein
VTDEIHQCRSRKIPTPLYHTTISTMTTRNISQPYYAIYQSTFCLVIVVAAAPNASQSQINTVGWIQSVPCLSERSTIPKGGACMLRNPPRRPSCVVVANSRIRCNRTSQILDLIFTDAASPREKFAAKQSAEKYSFRVISGWVALALPATICCNRLDWWESSQPKVLTSISWW